MDKREIILIVVGVLVGIFTGLIPLFKKLATKTETKIDDKILEIAIRSVKFVETNFLNSSNKSKKLRAMDILENTLLAEGVKNVSEKVLDKAVEKAVTNVKLNELVEKGELKGE